MALRACVRARVRVLRACVRGVCGVRAVACLCGMCRVCVPVCGGGVTQCSAYVRRGIALCAAVQCGAGRGCLHAVRVRVRVRVQCARARVQPCVRRGAARRGAARFVPSGVDVTGRGAESPSDAATIHRATFFFNGMVSAPARPSVAVARHRARLRAGARVLLPCYLRARARTAGWLSAMECRWEMLARELPAARTHARTCTRLCTQSRAHACDDFE